MDDDKFWQVEPGRGMGPLELGVPCTEIFQRLKKAEIEVELDMDGEDFVEISSELCVDDIDTLLVFSNVAPHALVRLDVEDERIKFGPLPVIGKRIHEIVELLKIPREETLWCDDYEDLGRPNYAPEPTLDEDDATLVSGGTLWITSLGMGFSLFRGTVATVHLCDPQHSPKIGAGRFTVEQRRISEVSPTAEELNPTAGKGRSSGSMLSVVRGLLHLSVFAALAYFVLQGAKLQQRWNQVPDVEAEVVAVSPPPPNPFPDTFTVAYVDTTGTKHQVVLGRADIYVMPKIGETVTIRYLPEAPGQALGPVKFRDIAFDTFIPYAIVTFAVYSLLVLLTGFVLMR